MGYLIRFFVLSMFVWQSLCAYELGIVTMFRNEAPYLEEWIEYHRLLGVEHFFLYNDRSEDHWAEVLKPYIQSNIVEVIDWHAPPGITVFPVWQMDAYKDALIRAKGSYKWLAFIDVDEFILPKSNRTIVECLDQFFPTAGGVYVCWRNFGTGGVYIEPGEPILLRLTAASSVLHPRNAAGKSIVRPDEVLIDHIWSPHQLVLKPGAQYYSGSGNPLYFEGTNLQVEPCHTSDFIQINHYALRDENYYQRVKLPRTKPQKADEQQLELSLLQEHYQSFSMTQDCEIIEFLKKNHYKMYRRFWKGPRKHILKSPTANNQNKE